MTTSSIHQFFESRRVSQSLCNERCQNILYKAVFEHFIELKSIATLLLASKSFQNSSFGANFLVNFVVNENTIHLLVSVLSPSSCFSLQFVPSLHIDQSNGESEKVDRSISDFVGELVSTKYFHSSLRSLTLHSAAKDIRWFFCGSSNNSWPQLHELSLKKCDLNDSVLEIISKNAIQLRSVNFSFNRQITDAGLDHISKFSGITTLKLVACKLLSDTGLRHVAKLSGITELDLSWCDKITDAGLELISNLGDIQTLDFAFCKRITDSGLEHLAKLANITSLDLSGCDKITDAGLEHISNLGDIQTLDLSRCYNITDAGLEHISKLAGITSLEFAGCFRITDAGLKHVCNLSKITLLDFSNCSEITHVGLERVSELSCLTSVTLYYCSNITTEAKTKFKIARPNCNMKA